MLKRRLEALAPAVERALAERDTRREQIRMEAELATAHADVSDSEGVLRGALESLVDPFLIASCIRDPDGTITGFRVRFANRAAEAFMGRTPGSLAGRPVPGAMPFPGATPFAEVIRTVLEGGEAWTEDGVEFAIPGSDGSVRRGLVNIQVSRSGDGFLANWRDVTETDRQRRERERLGAALEQTSDGVLEVNADGIITYANPAFLADRGLSLDEVVGTNAAVVGSSLLGPDELASLSDASRAGVPWNRRVAARHPDGSIHHFEVTARFVRDETGSMTNSVFTTRDVTDLARAEATLEQRRVLGSAVAEVAHRLLRMDNAVDVARVACEAVVAAGSAAMAWVGLVDPETNRIVPIGSHGDTGYLDAIEVRADASPLSDGPAGQAVRTHETVVVSGIASAPAMAPWQAAAEHHGYCSVAAFPLHYRDTTRGVFITYSAQADAFDPDVIEAIQQLAADVAAAIARLEETEQRRRLQDALAASERRFRETLAEVSLVAMMLDTHGTILFANRYLLALTGWSEAEIVGRAWHDVFAPPDGRAEERAAFLKVMETGTLKLGFRSRLLTRVGLIREMEWSSVLMHADDGSIAGLAGIAHDVTERTEAQTALEASEARLHAALNQMLEGVTLASAVRNEEGRIVDFRIDYVNPALARLGRVAAADQVDHTLLELFPAHEGSGLFAEYVEVVETGVPSEVEDFHFVDPDAAGGPLDQYLDLRAAKLGDGYVRSVRDVSERHQADGEMRRLHAAVEQSADAVMITNAAGVIEYVNPAFVQVSGYALGDAIGQNPRILSSGVQGPGFYAAMWAALSGGRSFTGDMVNRRKDGSLFREEAVISPVSDAAGTVVGYVAVKRDVTREREREAEQETMARERAMIAGSLSDIVALPTAALTAEAICRHVASLTGAASASIATFAPDGPAVSLGFVRADGVQVQLRSLRARRSRTLRERANAGPWVEAWTPRPSHPYARLHDELGTKALAYAPIRHGGDVVGLMTVTSSREDSVAKLTESLPALLEFAGIAGAIVGPSITDLAGVEHSRDRIYGLIRDTTFRPVFQPIVDLETGGHTGYEALTRFADGAAPDVVFADARHAGLETELELATLSAAIADAKQLPDGAWLSLNVSPGLVNRGEPATRRGPEAGRPPTGARGHRARSGRRLCELPEMRRSTQAQGARCRGRRRVRRRELRAHRGAPTRLREDRYLPHPGGRHGSGAAGAGARAPRVRKRVGQPDNRRGRGDRGRARDAAHARGSAGSGLPARPAGAGVSVGGGGSRSGRQTMTTERVRPTAERSAPAVSRTPPKAERPGISSRRSDGGITRSRPDPPPRPAPLPVAPRKAAVPASGPTSSPPATVATSLPDLLARAIAARGSSPFLGVRTTTTRQQSLTYAAFGAAVDNAAARLAAALPPRALVLVQGAPGPGFAAALFAAARANVILVPLDARMTADTVERIAALADPAAILLGAGATVEPVTSRRLASLPVMDLDELVDPALPAAVAALASRAAADPGDPLEILFTSGSTGNPKGVTVTQTMLLASTERCLATIPPGNNRFVSILPLSHIMEQVAGLIYAVAAGAETEYITTLRPDVIAAAIKGHRATALVVVPQVLEFLFAAIRREADRSGSGSAFRWALRIAPYLPVALRRRLFRKVHAALGGELRLVLSSAAHLPPSLQRSWEALGVEVVQGYGSTEAGLVATDFPGNTPVGSVGWTRPPMELRIEPDGEVVVRGPSVFTEYFRDPVATAAAFTPDGWYRTGDIGELDASGALRLIGRTRSLIALPSGMNVHPEDVEAALVAEGLAEPVVYEAPPGRIAFTYREGAAFSVPRSDEASALTAAVRAANRQLADHQRVAGRAPFPDEDFPRTHTRKVQRTEVAERMAGVPLGR